jgi:excisionase family DNA binding protein
LRAKFCNESLQSAAVTPVNTDHIMDANKSNVAMQSSQKERIAYSIPEAAEMLGLDYFSVYGLVRRGKLKACRVLRGKFLISRTELFRLLDSE